MSGGEGSYATLPGQDYPVRVDAGVDSGTSRHAVKNISYRILEKWLRTGLLTGSGEKWKERRHLLTPAFHFDVSAPLRNSAAAARRAASAKHRHPLPCVGGGDRSRTQTLKRFAPIFNEQADILAHHVSRKGAAGKSELDIFELISLAALVRRAVRGRANYPCPAADLTPRARDAPYRATWDRKRASRTPFAR